MPNLKLGDIVARKSYNYDVLFRVTRITGEMVDLVGITVNNTEISIKESITIIINKSNVPH